MARKYSVDPADRNLDKAEVEQPSDAHGSPPQAGLHGAVSQSGLHGFSEHGPGSESS